LWGGVNVSDFECRVCHRDLRPQVAEALTLGRIDFGYQRDSDGADSAGNRIVEVECPLGHHNSFRLRAAMNSD